MNAEATSVRTARRAGAAMPGPWSAPPWDAAVRVAKRLVLLPLRMLATPLGRRVEGAVSPRFKLRAGSAIGALLLLAVLTGRASPGFPLAKVGGAVGRTIQHAMHIARLAPPPPARGKVTDASSYALGDIPADYLALYVTAAGTCPQLRWQVLAGIGKVESDHGRSPAPGVRSGINAFGCCSGPMQFNIRNGPPSTWDSYGDGHPDHVYDPRYAIPAAPPKPCRDRPAPAPTHPPPTTPPASPAPPPQP